MEEKQTKQKEIQGVNNTDKSPFASNEQTIHQQPDKFILDFKNIYPQFIGNEPIMVINHRTIILDLYNVKGFLELLTKTVKTYEDKYGEIKKTKQIIQAEKEAKTLSKEATTTASKTPSYMG